MNQIFAQVLGIRRKPAALEAPAPLGTTECAPELPVKGTANHFGGLLSSLVNWIRDRRNKVFQSNKLRITDTISLGDKRFVSVVHVDGQRFLIGGSSSTVALLTPLEAPANTFSDALRLASSDQTAIAVTPAKPRITKAKAAPAPRKSAAVRKSAVTTSETSPKAPRRSVSKQSVSKEPAKKPAAPKAVAQKEAAATPIAPKSAEAPIRPIVRSFRATTLSREQKLVNRAERTFLAGVRHYDANRMDEAYSDFAAAIDLMLSSGLDLKGNQLLVHKFQSLVSRINALKMAAIARPAAFSPLPAPAPMLVPIATETSKVRVATVASKRLSTMRITVALLVFVAAAATMHAAQMRSPDMVTLPQGQESSLPAMRPLPPFTPPASQSTRRSPSAAAPADPHQITISGLGSNSPQWTIIVLMTFLTMIPSILICMTPFARLLVVFHFLRQALGLQTTPSNQTLVGLSLIMTFFLMQPVGKTIYEDSIVPMQSGQITAMVALDRGVVPLRQFMSHYVREKDVALFLDIAKEPRPATLNDVSLRVLLPAYVLSELKSGFQIGAVLFLPFLVVDMIVASITTSVGMMQLPPVVISTPLKLLLFLMVDGWHLLIGSLMRSFY